MDPLQVAASPKYQSKDEMTMPPSEVSLMDVDVDVDSKESNSDPMSSLAPPDLSPMSNSQSTANTSSSEEDSTKTRVKEEKKVILTEAEVKQCADLFRYVANFEDARQTTTCFTRTYNQTQTDPQALIHYDWTDNHFFREKAPLQEKSESKKTKSNKSGGGAELQKKKDGLSSKSKKELKEIAKSMGMKGISKMNMEQLRQAIRGQEDGAEGVPEIVVVQKDDKKAPNDDQEGTTFDSKTWKAKVRDNFSFVGNSDTNGAGVITTSYELRRFLQTGGGDSKGELKQEEPASPVDSNPTDEDHVRPEASLTNDSQVDDKQETTAAGNPADDVYSNALTKAKPWLIIPAPLQDHEIAKPPTILEVRGSDEERQRVEGYLVNLRDFVAPNRFCACSKTNVDDMLPFLMTGDLPGGDSEMAKLCRTFMSSVIKYYATDYFHKLYQHLFAWQEMRQNNELYIGIGHVRMGVTTSKNNTPHETKMVNGPLIDVLVKVELDRNTKDLTIMPANDAEVVINQEVFSAIISEGKSNSTFMDDLDALVDGMKVSNLSLDDPATFRELLDVASDLSCGGKVVSHGIKVDPHTKSLVIAESWCLYARQHKRNNFSRDARNIRHLVKNGSCDITDPILGLIKGPEYVGTVGTNTLDALVKEDNIIYPLPASRKQREVGVLLHTKQVPVVILKGPPGTGKTHTIVNQAATALACSKAVIVTSSNRRALKAFYDKLPPKLQALALDVASVEEYGIVHLQSSLDRFIRNIEKAKARRFDLENASKSLEKLKKERQAIFASFKQANDASRIICKDRNGITEFAYSLREFATSSHVAHRLTLWYLSGKAEVDDILRDFDSTKIKHVCLGGRNILFLGKDEMTCLIDPTFAVFVKKAIDEGGLTKTKHYFDEVSENEKCLDKITVGGRIPQESSDLSCVLDALDFYKKYLHFPSKEKCGAFAEEETQKEKRTTSSETNDEFAMLLQELKAIEGLGCINDEAKRYLTQTFESPISDYSQREYQALTKKIQKLEEELVYLKVILSLKEKMQSDQMSTLKKMSQSLSRAKAKALGSGTATSEKGDRHLQSFLENFRKAAKFMPFLILSDEQCGEYLDPTHRCDLGIVDEASQSSCSMVNFKARCRQLLVVGDSNQVSPSIHNSMRNEGLIRRLMRMTPQISAKEQLLPESSFFDLNEAAFPSCEICLDEHYRSVPDVINISNQLFYINELCPLRLPGKRVPLQSFPVDAGEKDKKEKKNINNAEAVKIKDLMISEMKKYVQKQVVPTMMVIGMVGSDQHKEIQKLLEDDQEYIKLYDEYGSSTLERHNILFGTPKECQGAERNIVYISSVSVANERTKMKQDDNWKEWNVAMTRAQDTTCLVHSYGTVNLKETDVRRKIFRYFLDHGKNGTAKDDDDDFCMLIERDPLLVEVEGRLQKALTDKGYEVFKKGSGIWRDAVCVTSAKSHETVMIHFENYGESSFSWETMFDQQLSLVRAKRICLRLDFISAMLNFDQSLDDVFNFLKEHLLDNQEAKRIAISQIDTTSESPNKQTKKDY